MFLHGRGGGWGMGYIYFFFTYSFAIGCLLPILDGARQCRLNGQSGRVDVIGFKGHGRIPFVDLIFPHIDMAIFYGVGK